MKKIAVMLPAAYRGGTLRVARNITRAIAHQAQQRGDETRVIFSYLEDGAYDLDADFGVLRECGVELRGTRWVTYPRAALDAVINLVGLDSRSLSFPEYCLPLDSANDFYDCDLWVIVSDRLPAPLLPIRKYVCFIYDYIQRYDPAIFGFDDGVWNSQTRNLLTAARAAARVFVSTPSTQGDLISYAGVEKARISLLDMDFDVIVPAKASAASLRLPENYFIWTTNSTHHKNHMKAFDALETYVQELDGKLSVVVTGYAMDYFDPDRKFSDADPRMSDAHIQYVRNKLSRNPTLKKRVRILGNVSDGIYGYVMQNARFLWHPGMYDNGTISAIEAAYFGVPTLSSRYPAQEHKNRKFGLNMRFFNAFNSREMAESLLAMEREAGEIQLPAPAVLAEQDWKKDSASLYQALIELT